MASVSAREPPNGQLSGIDDRSKLNGREYLPFGYGEMQVCLVYPSASTWGPCRSQRISNAYLRTLSDDSISPPDNNHVTIRSF